MNMEKGLEITFNVNVINSKEIVEALANLTGNEFRNEIEIHWRIFHVKLGDNRFYKVCYTGPKLTKLHPLMEEKVKKRFDELAHYTEEELMKIYNEESKNHKFTFQHVIDKKEGYSHILQKLYIQ